MLVLDLELSDVMLSNNFHVREESFEVEDFMIQIKLLVHVWKFSFMFLLVYLE